MYILAFLFLPGTFLHELAHYLTAMILFVHTGNMSLWPKETGKGIKFGSVMIQKTDFIRHFIIGIAPVLFGLALILGLFYYVTKANLYKNVWIVLISGYLIFNIGNTMFSSQKDMEGALKLLIFIIILIVISYSLGLRISTQEIEKIFSQPQLTAIFQHASLYLSFPIIIDAFSILLLKIFHK